MKEKLRRIPLPGQRILRSVIVTGLCFAIYFLRGRRGIPFFSVIAGIQCVTQYTKAMWRVGIKRIYGTALGAFWGLAVLLLERRLLFEGVPDEMAHYLLLTVFVGVVLYFTVLLGVTEASYFTVVVFLGVAVNHIGDADPWLYALNRLLDTSIGVLVAEVVNRLHLPRRRNTDTLFVSGVGESILGADRRLSPYSHVELNRLIEDGAKFTVSTGETQATVRELLEGVDLRYPIVTMNGAALYNMSTMEYLCTMPMSPEKSGEIIAWAEERDAPCFTNSVEDNLLVVRYDRVKNEGMRMLMENKRRSPYRNYVHGPTDPGSRVLYFLLLDTPERMDGICADFLSRPWAGEFRLLREKSEYAGYDRLKIYDKNVSKETMLRVLEERMGTKKTVTFGCAPGKFDVLIREADRDQVVKELKKRFEPVDLRGWRNILRW